MKRNGIHDIEKSQNNYAAWNKSAKKHTFYDPHIYKILEYTN